LRNLINQAAGQRNFAPPHASSLSDFVFTTTLNPYPCRDFHDGRISTVLFVLNDVEAAPPQKILFAKFRRKEFVRKINYHKVPKDNAPR
jgi:hypothetical protein